MAGAAKIIILTIVCGLAIYFYINSRPDAEIANEPVAVESETPADDSDEPEAKI